MPRVERTRLALGRETARRGRLDPAVVGHIDDDGVLREVFFLKVTEQLAARFIKPFTHRPVARQMRRIGLGRILLEQTLGRCMGCVWHERRIPYKERFLLLSRLGDEIVDRLHALAADGEARIAVARTLRHAVSKATTREVTLPPLASLENSNNPRSRAVVVAWVRYLACHSTARSDRRWSLARLWPSHPAAAADHWR